MSSADHLGPDDSADVTTEASGDRFEPLGVNVIGNGGAGLLPVEMVALGVREDAAPLQDGRQFNASRHRWGGRLVRGPNQPSEKSPVPRGDRPRADPDPRQ